MYAPQFLGRGGSLPPVGVRPSSTLLVLLQRTRVGRIFLRILCLCVLICFCFVLWTLLTDAMGQTQTTPLSIMIDHFKEVKGRASNLSVEVWKDWWQTFCSREWPTFSVGWPPEGTFDLPTIHRVRDIVSQPKKGHPNQLPYIITWQDLVEDPPYWLKPFLPPPTLFFFGRRLRLMT